MRKVLLTPIGLWWEENDKVVVIFIRHPETEEIVDEAVTSEALAEKTGMNQEKARQIFQEAYAALERRMGSGQEQGRDERPVKRERGQGDKLRRSRGAEGRGSQEEGERGKSETRTCIPHFSNGVDLW